MHGPACRIVLLGLFVASFTLAPSPASAQDGPLRQRLKERWAQRQPAKPGSEAGTDADGRITKPGDYRFTIQHDGLARVYRVHVPPGLDAARPAPLLFALHGGGGSMDYQADNSKYGLIDKSDKEGFVVVFPNGVSKFKSGLLATWNAGTCCGAARDAKVDDVGFIREIIAKVTGQIDIDRQRIYATGMSNGAMMAYRLACEMSDVFKAIAPVAGTDNTVACSPVQPVSVLHIHAKNDSHVLFAGGAGPDARDKSVITEFTSVPATVEKWTRLNGCNAPARRIVDKPGAYCELYSPCKGQTEVQLCVTEAGGHSWPGGSKPRGETPSTAISANDVMWEFFERQPKK